MKQISPITFNTIRNNMIHLCKKEKINARYDNNDEHGINIPGFKKKAGHHETTNWPNAIASISLQNDSAIKTLRKSNKKIQSKNKCKTILDCSSYIQVLFLTALINTIKNDTLLKSVLLNLIITEKNTNQNLIIAPAGATTYTDKPTQGFLYEMKNYLDIHTIETKSTIKSIINSYNLKEGDIVYIENHQDYENWAPNGAWAGEWCLLTSITPENIKLFGFGPGELSYNKMVSTMAKNAYEEKNNFDNNILGKIHKCIKSNNPNKTLENYIHNNCNVNHILNNSILTNVDTATTIIKNITSKNNSRLNIFKKALKKTKKNSQKETIKNGPTAIFKNYIFVTEIIQFNDSKINTLFLNHTENLQSHINSI
jgi:hypothetical protein